MRCDPAARADRAGRASRARQPAAMRSRRVTLSLARLAAQALIIEQQPQRDTFHDGIRVGRLVERKRAAESEGLEQRRRENERLARGIGWRNIAREVERISRQGELAHRLLARTALKA